MNAAARRVRKAAAKAGITPVTILYVRVSTDEQVDSGASLTEQEARLISHARNAGWEYVVIRDPGVSGKSLNRPGITEARQMLADGRADRLIAIALDRISRSVIDVSALMAESVEQGWSLVSVREVIDTGTPMGRAFVQIAAVFAELERGLIGERVKAGMAQRKHEGGHMGRHSTLDRASAERARELAATLSIPAVAAQMTTEGKWATPRGSIVWTASSVRNALRANLDPPPKHVRD